VLLADVSELSIGSIFIGRWMKNSLEWGGGVYIQRRGENSRTVAEPMGIGSGCERWVDAPLAVEGGVI
jgi:hypothetical protein